MDSGPSFCHCPCSVTDMHGSNDKFLEDMSHLATKANCKLVVCPRLENRNDRWIQVGARLTQGRTVSGWWVTGGNGWVTGVGRGRSSVMPTSQVWGHGPACLEPEQPGTELGAMLQQEKSLLPPPDALSLGWVSWMEPWRLPLLPHILPKSWVVTFPETPEEAPCRSFFFIQDEMEFGYIDAPHKSFPVVFDSPRNRGLRDFALKKILVCGQVHRAGMGELGGRPLVAPLLGAMVEL